MEITKDKVVAFDYILKDEQNNVLEVSDKNKSLVYIHGYKNLIPGLEKAFDKKKTGDSFQVTIPPEEGYGLYDKSLLMSVEKSELGIEEELKVGSELEAHTDDEVQIYTITNIDGDTVELDGNHPLAGKTLVFTITIADIREATEEEKEHGHVHNDDSCCS